jgi:hypothetical protein
LRVALKYARWGLVPKAGGEEDQEYGLLDHAAMAYNVYQAVKLFGHGTTVKDIAQCQQDNPELFEIYQWVTELSNGH